MRIGLAVQVFFKALFNAEFAAQVQQIVAGKGLPAPTEPTPSKPAAPKITEKNQAGRSDAITLLATLQREARFVDICKEPLNEYSDEQIGAAARDVLRDCGGVLDRLFELSPVSNEEDGAEVEAPVGYDAARFKLTGKVEGDPPFRGQLVHHGWEARKCELPQWSGSKDAALVIAPVEVEVKS